MISTTPGQQNFQCWLIMGIAIVFMYLSIWRLAIVTKEHARITRHFQKETEDLDLNRNETSQFYRELHKMNDDADFILDHYIPLMRKKRVELTRIKCLSEIPENLMSKWVPDQARFRGVEEFLYKKQLYGTEEERMYKTGQPRFQRWYNKKTKLNYTDERGNKSQDSILYEGCVYVDEAGDVRIYIKDGDLYINQKYSNGKKKHEFTRVYYIKAEDLIQMNNDFYL